MSVGLKANVDGTSGAVQVNGNDVVTVNSSGNVGIGTNNPSVKLHVIGSATFGANVSTGAGVSTGDVTLELGNERSGDGNCIFDFHARSGTDYEARLIRNPGANGVFEINNRGTGDIVLSTGTTQAIVISTGGTLTSGPTYTNTATGSTVVVTSTGLIRRTSSSIKYKKDVETLDPTLATNAINNLRPVWYRTKNAEGDDKATWSHIGLIAEEVHEVEPRLVRYRTAEVVTDEEGNRTEVELETPEPEDVDYARLSVLLLAEVKELRARVAALEAK